MPVGTALRPSWRRVLRLTDDSHVVLIGHLRQERDALLLRIEQAKGVIQDLIDTSNNAVAAQDELIAELDRENEFLKANAKDQAARIVALEGEVERLTQGLFTAGWRVVKDGQTYEYFEHDPTDLPPLANEERT